jgi:hypothetical protein
VLASALILVHPLLEFLVPFAWDDGMRKVGYAQISNRFVAWTRHAFDYR